MERDSTRLCLLISEADAKQLSLMDLPTYVKSFLLVLLRLIINYKATLTCSVKSVEPGHIANDNHSITATYVLYNFDWVKVRNISLYISLQCLTAVCLLGFSLKS
jgi:hypothetical protein